MRLLRRIPVKYTGELHEVKLLNFSVDIHEVAQMVPAAIKVRKFNGRAMISMVNVMLKNMHPSCLPRQLNFSYRHIAFRLLVDDSEWSGGQCKGVYFLRSFTDKPSIVMGGNLFTDYKLENANITCVDDMLELRQDSRFLTYALEDASPAMEQSELRTITGSLDRAYFVFGNRLRVVQIQREKWPLEEVGCYHFQTNFFGTARLEAAFRVREAINYQWLPPKTLATCG